MSSSGSVKLAKIISAALNAPLVAAVTFAVLAATEDTPSWPTVLFISVLFAAVLPVAELYALAKKKFIPDVYASDRRSRTLPLSAAVVGYGVGFALLMTIDAPPLVSALMLCYLVNTVVMTFINLFWKISIHATGVAGPAAAFGSAFGPPGYLFLLTVIPVGWARVTLKAHSPFQVAGGALLAILLTSLELAVYVPRL
jgi:membrane-associated phospholipid phosphatase